jgi:sugar phosphate isomerase/epimerase
MASSFPASRQLSLAHLTIGEVLPPDVAAIAAATGFDSISLRLNSPRSDVPSPPMIGDTAMRRATRRSLSDNGMRLLNIEAVLLRPGTDVSSYAALFDSAAYLGAEGALVVGLDADEARLIDHFAALADLAAPYKVAMQLEFMVFSEVKSLSQAVRIVRGAGAATAGVIVDALHLQRTGGTPADVAATERTLIAGVQLCDGPPAMEAEGIISEARCDRQFLGEGAFPLAQLLAVIPEALPIALEIPAERLRLRGESALQRAQRARDSFTRMFE